MTKVNEQLYVEDIERATTLDEHRQIYENQRKSTNIDELLTTFAKFEQSHWALLIALDFRAFESSCLCVYM